MAYNFTYFPRRRAHRLKGFKSWGFRRKKRFLDKRHRAFVGKNSRPSITF